MEERYKHIKKDSTISNTPSPENHYTEGYRYDTIPPPPPMYPSISLVGGSAADLPTHGHNQIYVNNVRNPCLDKAYSPFYIYIFSCPFQPHGRI